MASSCSRGAGCHCSTEKTMAWLLFHISPRHALAVSWEGQVRWRTILHWAPKAAARLLCRLQGGLWVRGLAEKGPRKPARRGRAGWWGRGQHLRLALSHANSSQGLPPTTAPSPLGWAQPWPWVQAQPPVGEKQPLWAPFPHQGTCPSGKGGGNGDSGAMGVAWGKELVLGMAHLRSLLGGSSSLPAEESAPTSQCSRGAFLSMKTCFWCDLLWFHQVISSHRTGVSWEAVTSYWTPHGRDGPSSDQDLGVHGTRMCGRWCVFLGRAFARDTDSG